MVSSPGQQPTFSEMMLQQYHKNWLQFLITTCVILQISACSDTDPNLSGTTHPIAKPVTSTSTTTLSEPLAVDLEHLESQVSALLSTLLEKARHQPGSGNLRGELAMAYEVNGYRDAALSSYEQAEALSPQDARWPYFQARLLVKQGDVEKGLIKMRQSLALEPDYIPSLMWQGTWLLGLGHLLQAEASFSKAKELGLGWAAEASLARVLLKQNRANEAVKLLEALSLKSPFHSIFHLLGVAYRDSGALDKARIALARGKNTRNISWLDPWEDLMEPYRVSFEARLRAAQTLIRRSRITEAISVLQHLQETQPDNPVVLTTLSNAYVLNGEQQRGFWVLRRALENEPVHHTIHLNIAGFYQSRGDTDTALQHINNSIQISPDTAEPYARKALILKQIGALEEALTAYDLALEKDASNPQRFIEAGDIHRAMNRLSQARSRYQHAVSVDPSYLAGYLRLANLLISSGQFDEAQQVIDQASLLGDQTGQLDAVIRRFERMRLH